MIPHPDTPDPHDAQARAGRSRGGASPEGSARTVPADFDARLRKAVRRAADAEARAHDDHHWSPMVGGDLRGPDLPQG